MERNHSIDIAKGIAIILMVIGHCYHEQNIVLKLIYAFHMPLFFMVSGALYSKKEKWGGKFSIKKKIRSLLIPYFTFELLFVFFISALTGFNDILPKLISIVTLAGVTVTWFLPCLFIVELIFYSLKYTKRFRLVIVVALFFVGLCFPFSGYGIVISRTFVGLGFYGFGFVCSDWIIKKQRWYIILLSLAIFVASALLNDNVSMVDSKYGFIPLYVLSSLAGSLCLVHISVLLDRLKTPVNRFIGFLGMNTLIILCTHMFLIEVIRLCDYKLLNNWLTSLGIFEGFLMGAFVILCEMPIIFISNRYLWFLYGKNKK